MKFKSAILTQASGSVGGATYSRNRGGMYIRARSVPTNPSSAFQETVRALVASLTTAWVSTLTAAQRSAWNVYAENVLMPDSLGEARNIGGLGHYIRSNVPRMQAGLSRIDDGPTVYSLPTFTAPTIDAITAADDDADITFTAADDWATETGGALIIAASRPQNVSINYFTGPYRYAGLVEGDDTTPPTSPAAIDLPFAVTAGQRVFFRMRVCRADGRLSLPFRLFDTAS